jgi:hypothetical protein
MGRFIPFDFSTHFLEALRSCYYVLKHGKGLCFFPKGYAVLPEKLENLKKVLVFWLRRRGHKLGSGGDQGAHEAWPSTAKYPKLYPITG